MTVRKFLVLIFSPQARTSVVAKINLIYLLTSEIDVKLHTVIQILKQNYNVLENVNMNHILVV